VVLYPRETAADVERAAVAFQWPGPRALPGKPSGGAVRRREAESPFRSDEPFFRPVDFLVEGSSAAPLPDTAQISLDEDFSAGLGRWEGGVEDWKVDAAGVRVGSLALFKPSAGLRDYDLDFVAKIGNRSVSWVFRAADPDNYHAVTLALAGAGMQLTRWIVLGGKPEPAVSTPLKINLRSRQTFRVRTSVAGCEFSVDVEGSIVARWSDARLEAGGVGFMARQDDRARLYRVQLSGREGPSPRGSGRGGGSGLEY
jgi:hypothetical protein